YASRGRSSKRPIAVRDERLQVHAPSGTLQGESRAKPPCGRQSRPLTRPSIAAPSASLAPTPRAASATTGPGGGEFHGGLSNLGRVFGLSWRRYLFLGSCIEWGNKLIAIQSATPAATERARRAAPS